MPFFDSMIILTPYPILSALLWIIAALLALYLARKYFHQFVRAVTRLIHNTMRLASASVCLAEKRLEKRNREVLIERGRQSAERKVEREFYLINSAVERNLKGYAALHLQISELIAKLEEDHRNSMDVPPDVPNWRPVIEAIAKIEHPGDTMVAQALTDIRHTIEAQNASAMDSYRSASKARHGILNKMLPRWMRLHKALGAVQKSVTSLIDRSKSIDRHMNEYEQIRAETDTATHTLLMSTLTQFIVSGLFLMVAVGGAVINVHLIDLPFAEMVGGGHYIGPFKTSSVAAVVITAVELSLGIFIMESLRMTRLFPIVSSMDDRKRTRMFWLTLALLVIFAGVESSLAILRDRMMADMDALKQMLAGAEQTTPATSIIPAVGQMIIGFVLPFWIALGAIPLAAFISSSRSILGVMAAASLRMLAFFLRLCGNIAIYAGHVVVTVYDLIIFPTLWLESSLSGAAHKHQTASRRWTGLGFFKKFKDAGSNKGKSIELEESRK